MQSCKILMSNLGYARGIGGGLAEHVLKAHRHFYCSEAVQRKSLLQLGELIVEEDPDICCFAEIDKGSFPSAGFNQLEALLTEKYIFFDIENKYAPGSRLRSFFMTNGKCNAFLAKHPFPHHKLYFRSGVKRLVYKIKIDEHLTLFFAHFSLSRRLRRAQLVEARKLLDEAQGESVFLGDFNILDGLRELDPLLKNSPYILLNRDEPTFRFHKRHLTLDLCICSRELERRAQLRVVPQPYSDHAALVLDIRSS